MRYVIAIILFIIFSITMVYYDFEYDASQPEKAIHKMTYFMTIDEKMKFMKEMSILCQDSLCSSLDGLTEKQIHNEYHKFIEYRNEQNVKFLTSYMKFLLTHNQNFTSLHINKKGFIFKPKEGFIYKKEYSLDDLKYIIEIHGDIDKYIFKERFVNKLTDACNKSKKSNPKSCQCVANKFFEHYGYNYFANSTNNEMMNEHREILNQFTTKCKQAN